MSMYRINSGNKIGKMRPLSPKKVRTRQVFKADNNQDKQEHNQQKGAPIET